MPDMFAWYADSFDPRLASVRYRVLEPMAGLRAAGVPIERYDPEKGPAAYRAVIFCKSQTPTGLAALRSVKAAGGRVIYDLCDNVFAAHEAGHASAARVTHFVAMLREADALTFSTAMLKTQIEERVESLPADRVVIPDTLDTDQPDASQPSWTARLALARLDRFLKRHQGALHAIWFGNTMGRLSGYVHVARAVEHLSTFSRSRPVTLTVMSNHRLGYYHQARHWPIPHHYVGWNLEIARAVLARHRVAVIPVEGNDYTAGKTLNRPAAALLEGLAVVSDAIPSYGELADFITLGDWQSGLAENAEWSATAQARVANGAAYLRQHYNRDAVAQRWRVMLGA